jgi:hypothetical protein
VVLKCAQVTGSVRIKDGGVGERLKPAVLKNKIAVSQRYWVRRAVTTDPVRANRIWLIAPLAEMHLPPKGPIPPRQPLARHFEGPRIVRMEYQNQRRQPDCCHPVRKILPRTMKGRAWIAADSYQIMRLETDLIAPLPEIRLATDRAIIEYGPVHFQQGKVDMWLPQSAELYYDWKGRRSHRRHSFSNYLLFSVGDRQNISAPKIEE